MRAGKRGVKHYACRKTRCQPYCARGFAERARVPDTARAKLRGVLLCLRGNLEEGAPASGERTRRIHERARWHYTSEFAGSPALRERVRGHSAEGDCAAQSAAPSLPLGKPQR